MKKIISLCLIAAMLLGCCFLFGACGEKETVKDPDDMLNDKDPTNNETVEIPPMDPTPDDPTPDDPTPDDPTPDDPTPDDPTPDDPTPDDPTPDDPTPDDPTPDPDPDPDPDPKPVTHVGMEFSALVMGPALVTCDSAGKRLSERFNQGSVEYIYDQDGLLCEIDFQMAGRKMAFVCTEYDAYKMPSRFDVSQGDDTFILTSYENGKLIQMVFAEGEGEDADVAFIYNFAQDGSLMDIEIEGNLYRMTYQDGYISKVTVTEGMTKTLGEIRYLYSENKDMLKEEYYNAEENGSLTLVRKSEITHSDKGHEVLRSELIAQSFKITAKIVYSAKWEALSAEQYTYSDDGELIEKEVQFMDEEGQIITENYVFDELVGGLSISKRIIVRKNELGESVYMEWQTYFDGGLLYEKTLIYTDDQGREVYESYEYFSESEGLILRYRSITAYDENGEEIAYETYEYNVELGELVPGSQWEIVDGVEIYTMYEPDGSVFQISKTYIDQNGNTVDDLYYPSESGEGFYHAYHDVYDENNNPVEGYELDEFGTLWMTYSRSEREGGGFYVDYYYLNEDTGELEYFYSDEYDENGDIIWNDKDWF